MLNGQRIQSACSIFHSKTFLACLLWDRLHARHRAYSGGENKCDNVRHIAYSAHQLMAFPKRP